MFIIQLSSGFKRDCVCIVEFCISHVSHAIFYSVVNKMVKPFSATTEIKMSSKSNKNKPQS